MTTRNHKVKSHYGMDDYYKHYKKNTRNAVDSKTHRNVLREMNKTLGNELATIGYEIKLPKRMGIIRLHKTKSKCWFDKGKLKTNKPVDFKTTIELWNRNPAAKAKKTLVRYENAHSDGYTFKIFYSKKSANYKNKSIYQIQVNRQVKRKLNESIKLNKVDALLRY